MNTKCARHCPQPLTLFRMIKENYWLCIEPITIRIWNAAANHGSRIYGAGRFQFQCGSKEFRLRMCYCCVLFVWGKDKASSMLKIRRCRLSLVWGSKPLFCCVANEADIGKWGTVFFTKKSKTKARDRLIALEFTIHRKIDRTWSFLYLILNTNQNA